MTLHWRHMHLLVSVFLLLLSCSNNPYPNADSEQKILYSSYPEAPRTMDPAVSYTTNSHTVIANVYETLLEYHYLKRPYELIPGLAQSIPVVRKLSKGRVAYRFEIRSGMLYQDDPAFALGGEGRRTREIVAEDFVFELLRIGDPELSSPVQHVFSKIVGLHEFGVRLTERRKANEAFAGWKERQQYEAVGSVEGLRVLGDHVFEIVLDSPYPQILYWFAMPFTTAVPWEAVHYYDGEEGRPRFADHPVGMGPYRIAQYDKQFRIVLEKNPNWYGVMHPEWKAPGTLYPSAGEAGDLALGRLGPGISGRPLPLIDRIEFRREKESIPRFNKFLQGYYDKSVIIKESFDNVIQADHLSPEIQEMGVELDKTVELGVFYIGFNQEDPIFGRDNPERSRKLRQAMSLAIDAQEFIDLFLNGIGISAQTPLPPGLFGYDPEYRNSFREVDIERAKRILAEAGYPGGIDSETQRPMKLTFDT